jgi:hypothetical protein
MSNPQDPLAAYVQGQTGILPAYTTGLEQFGYLGAPFGGVDQNFQSQVQFQNLLKSVLDQQLQGFNNNNNINALPYNLRSIYQGAAPLLTDPWFGVIGAPGMFNNGYQQGPLPNNPSPAYRVYKEQASGYPNFPAPSALYGATGAISPFSNYTPTSGGSSNSGGSLTPAQAFQQNYPTQAAVNNPSNALVGHYTVPLVGGGSVTVNASSPQAAIENVKSTGNNPTGSDITGQAPRAPSLTG